MNTVDVVKERILKTTTDWRQTLIPIRVKEKWPVLRGWEIKSHIWLLLRSIVLIMQHFPALGNLLIQTALNLFFIRVIHHCHHGYEFWLKSNILFTVDNSHIEYNASHCKKQYLCHLSTFKHLQCLSLVLNTFCGFVSNMSYQRNRLSIWSWMYCKREIFPKCNSQKVL
jgi:hypothetical protein